MSSLLKYLIAGCLFLVLVGISSVWAAAQGFVEGHLKIISLKEVELAEENPSPKGTGENYTLFPLIVRTADGQKEVRQIVADANGNYRLELPAGNYILDVARRGPTRLRSTPQTFTVVSGQTVRVDMDIDTGVR